MSKETIIFKDCRNILNEREEEYGYSTDTLTDIGRMWQSFYGTEYSAKDVAMMLCLMKLIRESNQHKYDNIIDAINYLVLYEKIFLEEEDIEDEEEEEEEDKRMCEESAEFKKWWKEFLVRFDAKETKEGEVSKDDIMKIVNDMAEEKEKEKRQELIKMLRDGLSFINKEEKKSNFENKEEFMTKNYKGKQD